MRMKKRQKNWSIMVLYIAVIIMSIYLNKDVEVMGTRSLIVNGSYIKDIDIISNRKIQNKEQFAEEIYQRCINNKFDEIIFRYDEIGYPTEWDITVYLNKSLFEKKIKYFSFRIKDNRDLCAWEKFSGYKIFVEKIE